jgi:hypothetical protein
VTQSEGRIPGRRPRSFGRTEAEGEPVEDMTIRGGQAFHLVLHLDVIPSEKSLAALRAAIAATTRDGVLDGYAAAFEVMESDEPPGGGHGGAPPGPDQQQGVAGD